MKRLLAFAFVLIAALPAAARESFQSSAAAQPAPHPSLYSFADVYRLTVGGTLTAVAAANPAEPALRVAVSQGASAPEQQFSISAVREPGRWALLIAGLLLMAWVAWRRMDFTL